MESGIDGIPADVYMAAGSSGNDGFRYLLVSILCSQLAVLLDGIVDGPVVPHGPHLLHTDLDEEFLTRILLQHNSVVVYPLPTGEIPTFPNIQFGEGVLFSIDDLLLIDDLPSYGIARRFFESRLSNSVCEFYYPLHGFESVELQRRLLIWHLERYHGAIDRPQTGRKRGQCTILVSLGRQLYDDISFGYGIIWIRYQVLIDPNIVSIDHVDGKKRILQLTIILNEDVIVDLQP